ncbi:hypothetical protein [Lacinutrix himadriensis]|uniref:hypothetical protein n=1 Tax=Lacinutrix himadriensis TaxID=641549 RepID=UPI0006E3C8BB|nr:hypothetical protein [Lacinutrix himadriensis]
MCKENGLEKAKCEESNAKLIIRANNFENAKVLVKKNAKENSEILKELSNIEKMLELAEKNEDDKNENQEIRIRLCKWKFCITVLQFWKKIDIDININL